MDERNDLTGRAIAASWDDVSNWYVRLSRRRLWDGDAAPFWPCTSAAHVAKLLAPLTHFIADEIYDNLDGREPSCTVRLPEPGEATRFRDDMQVVRDAVELGRAPRTQPLKVRQPLARWWWWRERDVRTIERLERIMIESQREVGALRVRGRRAGRSSSAQLPRDRAALRQKMPKVAAAVAASTRAGARGGRSGINIEGAEQGIGQRRRQDLAEALEGSQVERAGTHDVALNLGSTTGCAAKAWPARGSCIQGARKSDGRTWRTDRPHPEARRAVAAHAHSRSTWRARKLATSVTYEGAGERTEIEGRPCDLGRAR